MEENLKNEIIELIKELNNKDSIEIGNSKTGSIKVYVNFEDKEKAKQKILNAVELLKDNRNAVFNKEVEVKL